MRIDVGDLIGRPFESFGAGPCYELAIEVFRRYGVEIPLHVIDWNQYLLIEAVCRSEIKRNWKRIAEPAEPCAILMRIDSRYINHVGVYIGGGKMIHVMTGGRVKLSRITSEFYKSAIEGFFEYDPRITD